MSNLKIEEIIRYALAGGVALLAVWLGYKEPNSWLASDRQGALISTAFIALPVVIGALSYILHRALLFPIAYKALALLCGRGGNTYSLDIERWKNQLKLNALQPRMAEWAAQVHFLYSAFVAQLFANLVAHLGDWTQSSWHWLGILSLPLMLIAALIHHYRYLQCEAEVFKHDINLQ